MNTTSSNNNGARGKVYNSQNSQLVESNSSFNPVSLVIWVLFIGMIVLAILVIV